MLNVMLLGQLIEWMTRGLFLSVNQRNKNRKETVNMSPITDFNTIMHSHLWLCTLMKCGFRDPMTKTNGLFRIRKCPNPKIKCRAPFDLGDICKEHQPYVITLPQLTTFSIWNSFLLWSSPHKNPASVRLPRLHLFLFRPYKSLDWRK